MTWEGPTTEYEWYEQIGSALRVTRKKRGQTIYDVAAVVGTSAVAISRWERGLDRMKAWHYVLLQREGLLP